ncbi:MAG: ArsR/SmtB family transcription factor [Alishewanella aestuarii]
MSPNTLLLSKTSCIGSEITNEAGLAQSAVSEHLRILKAAGVVVGEIEHPRVCYSLSCNSLLPLLSLLQQVASREASTDGAICQLTENNCR